MRLEISSYNCSEYGRWVIKISPTSALLIMIEPYPNRYPRQERCKLIFTIAESFVVASFLLMGLVEKISFFEVITKKLKYQLTKTAICPQIIKLDRIHTSATVSLLPE